MAGKDRAFVNPVNLNLACLKKYMKPRPSFKKTQSLEDVLDLTKHKIVHLYGMSGCGKSQIVAAVCEKLDQNPGRIVWHVQCQAGTGMLQRKWREFARELQRAGLISQTEGGIVCNALINGVESDMKKFLDIINRISLAKPILFAIEDIADKKEKEIVRTLINCMETIDPSVLNIQLLIATQEKEVLYPGVDLGSMNFYKPYNVKGFSKDEAFDFLSTPAMTDLPIEDKEKVAKLAEELAYSPLGLLLAKSYCLKYRVRFEKYYDSLGKGEDVEKEKDLLKQHPDLGKNHRYEVILKLLSPVEEDEEKEKHVQFKVMKMLSFLSNQDIPCKVLEKFIQQVKPMDVNEQNNAVNYLLERLRREVDASVSKGPDLLTLHADILRALNASMQAAERRDVLADVVLALASIMDKDTRMWKEYGLLYDLKDHAESVARHSADYFKQLFDGAAAETKDYEILLSLSKLNEVIGYTISQHPGFREGNEEDKHYQRAMDCIWVIVCANTNKSFLPPWLARTAKKEEKTKQLISYEKGKDPRETAKQVFKKVKEASLANADIKEVLRKDRERLFPVKENHFNDMEKRLEKDGYKIDWEKMRQEIKEKGQLSDASLDLLKARKMVIDWKQLIECYLAERMGSIIHSWSRQDNYKGDIISAEKHEWCRWYVEFGFQLCDIAFQKTGVKSLFHFILRSNNKLPRLVRSCEGESDEDFQNRIGKSREIAHSLKKEDADFYEHGIYKPISGTAWTLMNALKYLIKANTKLQTRPDVAKDFPTATTDQECEELYKLCESNLDITMSTTCLVHAGKYFAATRKYTKALQTFESAFKWGIDDKLDKNPPTYAWALHNMGRAILAAKNELKDDDIASYIAKFNDRYENTKKNKTGEKWRKLLDDCKADLYKVF